MVRTDFVDYWDQITPETGGGWPAVEGSRDDMNWTTLNSVSDYAVDHGIPFHEMAFVSGWASPTWISGLTAEAQLEEISEWMHAFCECYPHVALIDVVMEPPPHTTPPYMAALGGEGASGYDWIIKSFELARDACPNAVLLLNDYNNIEYTDSVDNTIAIVQALKNANAPIDAIGCEAHDAYKLGVDVLEANIARLEKLGLPLYITQYDIPVADDEEQRAIMEAQFPLFFNNPKIKGITLWGYVMGKTWRSNTGLIEADGTPRPAMTWLMDYLGR
jgi:endo-1,4-beta-xylanase